MLSRSQLNKIDAILEVIVKDYHQIVEEIAVTDPSKIELAYEWELNFESSELEKTEFKTLKKEFRHYVDFERYQKYILSNITRADLVFCQTDLCSSPFEQVFPKHMLWILDEINSSLNIKYPDLAKNIKTSPKYWLRNEFDKVGLDASDRVISNDSVVGILDVLSNINDFAGNESFHAVPMTADFTMGYANNRKYFSHDKKFLVSYFDKVEKQYKSTLTNSRKLDANIALLYQYKGKESFLVSFFLDTELNVYIRQIQGLCKGRGFKSIGDNWQKRVVKELCSKLTFAKNVYLISGQSVKDSLIWHYEDMYQPKIHDELFGNVQAIYDRINDESLSSLELHVPRDNKNHPITTEIYYLQ